MAVSIISIGISNSVAWLFDRTEVQGWPCSILVAKTNRLITRKSLPVPAEYEWRLHKRNQATGESVSDYVTTLRKLAEHCEFNASLMYKAPNEIGSYRQISPYVTNYRNKIRLFMNWVGMLQISEIPDPVVVFPKKNDVNSDVNY